jgi:hypothetical protein
MRKAIQERVPKFHDMRLKVPPLEEFLEAFDALEKLMIERRATICPKAWASVFLFYGQQLREVNKWQEPNNEP